MEMGNDTSGGLKSPPLHGFVINVIVEVGPESGIY